MDYKAYVCLALSSLLLMVVAVQSQGTDDDEIQNEIRYNISEELQQGTFVGNVIQDADLKARFGEDQVTQMKLRFLSKPDLDLDIEEDTGIIRTGGRIDRDEICPGQTTCDYKLDIVAIIPGTNFLEIIKASVSVIDMNDNWPNFPRTEMHERILESADRGTSFRIPTAIDPDSGQLGIQRYVLQPDSNVFTLIVNRKMDGAIEVRLKLEGDLDRELQDTYEFQIVAFDGGDPPKSGSIDVLITVEDANDNDPVFDNTTYEVSLYENVPIQTTIIQVHATDKDAGLYGQVIYRFSPTTQENYGHLFGITNATGEVFVKGVIDYEISSIYHLSVSAYDLGPDSLPGDTTVIVKVQDINDNAPQITVNTLAATGTDTAAIDEDADLDTFVAYITVVDPDSGNNGKFKCSLNDNHFSLNRIGNGEYKVVTKAFLDRETRSDYNLAVMCDDQGRETQVAIKHVHIVVTDMNDNEPVFNKQSYAADVLENNLVGAPVVQVNATDKDTGINAELVYTLEDSVLNTFDINPATGAITAKTVFDREQVQQFQFQVFANDKGTPSHTSTTLVFVNIDDVNDEIPKFSQTTYSFGVRENSNIGTEVGIVHAVDLDAEPYNQFEFAFLPNEASMDKFSIDKESGKIITKAVLDRESDQLYYLTVLAADKGAPMISSTATVSVYVADENDNEPFFEYPSKYNNTVYISSRVPVGFVLTRLQAHDRDIGKNGNVTFSIYDGNEKNYFSIDPVTGAITVNLELKHINYEIFEFTVVVRDQGIPEKVGMGSINVVVNRSIGYPYGKEESSSLLGPNATIVISLACVSGVIVLCLIVAIVILRRQDFRDKHKKYNQTSKVLVVSGDVESPKHPSPVTGSAKTSGITWPITLKKKTTTIPPPPPAPARMGNGHPVSMAFEQSGVAPEKPPRSPLKAHSSAVSNPKYQVAPLGSQGTQKYAVIRKTNQQPTAPSKPDGNAPWLPSSKDIQVQKYLDSMKVEADSHSTSSGEGSNADSGRGPSEEGENNMQGGSRKRPHPGTSRSRDPSSTRPQAAAPADYRGQQEYGKVRPSTASPQQPPMSSFHPADPYYHQPGRAGHDTSLDSQYGSAGSMEHPYGDHTPGHPDHPPLQANYTSSPYLYRDHSGVHNAPPQKHHKGGLPAFGDLNRMSPIPEVSYNAPNRTASYSAPKNVPVINLHSSNSYRDPHRQASDTVV